MFKLRSAAAFAFAIAAVPAAATSYDAFASFNGTQGAGGFTYGIFDGTSGFTQFTANTNCFISGSTCLQALANHDVPGATKSLTTSFQYNSVNVPDDMLLVHPGANNGQAVYVMFTAPVSGVYSISGAFKALDTSPSGVDISVFFNLGGTLIGGPYGGLTTSGEILPFMGSGFALQGGDSIGFIVDKGATYNNDSTGINFTVVGSAVPETASWAMLIAGLGLTGAAMRRRRTVSVAA